MKKVSILLVALFIGAVGLQAQQKRVVHVQGHPHEYLTKKAAEGTWQKPHPKPAIKGSTTDVNFDDIQIWAEEKINPDWPIDSAVLIVKWTDAFDYSGEGVSSRVLGNGYVDGFVFAIDFSSEDMGGDYHAPSQCSIIKTKTK